MLFTCIGIVFGIFIRVKNHHAPRLQSHIRLNWIGFGIMGAMFIFNQPEKASDFAFAFFFNPLGIIGMVLFVMHLKMSELGDDVTDWPMILLLFVLAYLSQDMALKFSSNLGIGPSPTLLVLCILGFLILGFVHAWLGPVIAGLNLGMAIDCLLGWSAQSDHFVSFLPFIQTQDPWLTWVILISSTLLSLAGFLERLDWSDLLEELL